MNRRSFLKLIAGPAAAIAVGVRLTFPGRKSKPLFHFNGDTEAMPPGRWPWQREGLAFRPQNYQRAPKVGGITDGTDIEFFDSDFGVISVRRRSTQWLEK
jgi:hypothetical protein